MTFTEKFEQLKKKYGKIDEKKLNESFAVQIEMTDDDCGGIFYVAYVGGKFEIAPYDYHDNTASVKVSSAELEKLLSGKANPVSDYLDGKIEIDGNTSDALTVVEIMKKEAPAKKKAAPKKEATVKTAAPKKKKTEK